MPNPNELVPVAAVLRKLGLAESAAQDPDIIMAVAAADAYVKRYHPGRVTWTADIVLGAVKLAAGLHRDANTPGIAEPFAQGNVYKRATDVEIEQLCQIGRFAPPLVG